jgi:hypothetical protein
MGVETISNYAMVKQSANMTALPEWAGHSSEDLGPNKDKNAALSKLLPRQP